MNFCFICKIISCKTTNLYNYWFKYWVSYFSNKFNKYKKRFQAII